MRGRGTRTPVEAGRAQQWDSLRSLVRELEEERDLVGLAAVTEMGLLGLRQMCERPVTCEQLGEMLDGLRGLKLDAWESGEDE